MRKCVRVLTTCVLALGVLSAAASAKGEFDLTFGTSGELSTQIAPLDNEDITTALVLQQDGRIVAAGRSDMGAADGGQNLTVARFNTNGTFDSTFDRDGKLNTRVGPGDGDDAARAVAVQSDGKIVVAGRADMGVGAGGYDFVVARYNSDGSIDSSFAGDGIVTIGLAPGDRDDQVFSLLVQPDGRIVIAGASRLNEEDGGWQSVLMRFNPDGGLDTTFGRAGTVLFGLAGGDSEERFSAVTRQPDGKLVAAGYAGTSNRGYAVTVGRFNSDGSPDVSFSGDGVVIKNVAPGNRDDGAFAVALQPDGKIIIGGWSDMGAGRGGMNYSLIRYRVDGSLDDGFSRDGVLTARIARDDNEDWLTALVVQRSGKILTGGWSNTGAGRGGYGFSMARFNPDGSLDQTFSSDGKLSTHVAPGDKDDRMRGFRVQPDGKIIAAGWSNMGQGRGGMNSTLIRYTRNGGIDGLDSTIAVDQTGRVKRVSTNTLSGTATGAKQVQIALLRVELFSSGRRTSTRCCVWLQNSRAQFKQKARVGRRCVRPVWLAATGTSSWSFKLGRDLPAGKYVLYSRASGRGKSERSFSVRDGNRVAFTQNAKDGF